MLMLSSGGCPVQCDQFICHFVAFVDTCLQGVEGLPKVKRCGEPRPSTARVLNSYTRILLACELVCCRHVPHEPRRLIPHRLCSVTWTCHHRRFAYQEFRLCWAHLHAARILDQFRRCCFGYLVFHYCRPYILPTCRRAQLAGVGRGKEHCRTHPVVHLCRRMGLCHLDWNHRFWD